MTQAPSSINRRKRKDNPQSTWEQHVAHKLVIELLACQFAYPVQWYSILISLERHRTEKLTVHRIETQKKLFAREGGDITRLIELGPSKVLGNMARQTVSLQHSDSDLAKCITRQYLCLESDREQVRYEYDPPSEGGDHQDASEEAPVLPESTSSTQQTQVLAAPAPKEVSSESAIASEVPDAPISAREVAQALIAKKFNKAFDNVDPTKSIKDLSAGKSTLQNELIGILGEEFSTLPSAAEDLPLELLGQGLQPTFSPQLGKQSSAILAKMMSTKMPAGFNQKAICTFLETSFGLKSGRQTAVLLFAITKEPSARFPSTDAAKGFFEDTARAYATAAGIQLGTLQSAGTGGGATAAVMDTAQLEAMKNDQRRAMFKSFSNLADELEIDPYQQKIITELESGKEQSEQRLDSWSAELDEEFEKGIQPVFNHRKRRRFNSWWNNVRQDVVSLLFDISARDDKDLSDVSKHALHILNRGESSIEDMLNRSSARESLSSILPMRVKGEPVFLFKDQLKRPITKVTDRGEVEYSEQNRSIESYPELLQSGLGGTTRHEPCLTFLKARQGSQWVMDVGKTRNLLDVFKTGVSTGLSFGGRNILLIGAGPGSIGAEVLRALLSGGARVVVTTSREPSSIAKYYQELYDAHGARDSELVVLPFNQGSRQDCASLVDYIYDENGLALHLDGVIPFAAISESAEIDGIGSRSELAHRMMLTNVLRLLGEIIQQKEQRRISARPTQVLLPLSPNHGVFGGDGLYAESKLGLEGLLNRFISERWSDYLTVCGAVIGWTRGTGLMSRQDIVAEAIEAQGCLTFSQKEMAFNVVALLADPIAEMCEDEPVMAYIDGGLHCVPDLKSVLATTHADIKLRSTIRKAITDEDERQANAMVSSSHPTPKTQSPRVVRSNLKVVQPPLPDRTELQHLRHMQGMVDPNLVPVIVGFSELGPWGNARTRWSKESSGTFSLEGWIEMAWIMNLIKYKEVEDSRGAIEPGWVDAKTGERVADSDIEARYGSHILEHSGLRLVETDLMEGYDPDRKEYMHEVVIEADMPEFEASQPTAEAFALRHEDKAVIRQSEGGEWFVKLLRGATVMVPKSIPFEGVVAGQIPTGFDPTSYGIPEDIVRQVDPVTVYALCCASEALYSAGIADSWEIFKHIHISELGNFIGSMMGGTTKVKDMYKSRHLDKEVQSDVMQETYLSTTAAWVNMLLLGAAGPIKTPTGACATGIESIDSACDSLQSGKTKICFVGGTDDFQEDESYAFRTMGATVNARDELAKGRLPSEMSRPTADTRCGFVEAQGAGVQIVTTAKLALDMGLPIYGIIAGSAMAADKISRSVPAPGQGMLSFARETEAAQHSPLLNMTYRKQQLDLAVSKVQTWEQQTLQSISQNTMQSSPDAPDPPTAAAEAIKNSAAAQITDAYRLWTTDLRRQDPSLSPMRAALATWGLTVDDVAFASLHGTSTKANDKNEPAILHAQLAHLGRTKGNPMLAICQKALTGHPKAPAASFMLNGCLQAIATGVVPGNTNADNVDAVLRQYDHLLFPTRALRVPCTRLNAFTLTSFGFGQKGGQLIGVAPRLLFASLPADQYASYARRARDRARTANAAYLRAMATCHVVDIKPAPPYAPELERAVLMDPGARAGPASAAKKTPELEYAHAAQPATAPRPVSAPLAIPVLSPTPTSSQSVSSSSVADAARLHDFLASAAPAGADVSIGVDVEAARAIPTGSTTFVGRNFSAAERGLADARSGDRDAFLAGRWCAKEAIFKALRTQSRGAGAAMADIQVLTGLLGEPRVQLEGEAAQVAREQGIAEVKVSLSHGDDSVVAAAMAIRTAA